MNDNILMALLKQIDKGVPGIIQPMQMSGLYSILNKTLYVSNKSGIL